MKEHENGSLNLSRIHIGLNQAEDRTINYIYLKDNKFYSLGENILECSERSHTEILRENTLKDTEMRIKILCKIFTSNTDHDSECLHIPTHKHMECMGK